MFVFVYSSSGNIPHEAHIQYIIWHIQRYRRRVDRSKLGLWILRLCSSGIGYRKHIFSAVETDRFLYHTKITLEFSSFMLFCIALNLQYASEILFFLLCF